MGAHRLAEIGVIGRVGHNQQCTRHSNRLRDTLLRSWLAEVADELISALEGPPPAPGPMGWPVLEPGIQTSTPTRSLGRFLFRWATGTGGALSEQDPWWQLSGRTSVAVRIKPHAIEGQTDAGPRPAQSGVAARPCG